MYPPNLGQQYVDLEAVNRALEVHKIMYEAGCNKVHCDRLLFNDLVNAGSIGLAVGYWAYFKIRREIGL